LFSSQTLEGKDRWLQWRVSRPVPYPHTRKSNFLRKIPLKEMIGFQKQQGPKKAQVREGKTRKEKRKNNCNPPVFVPARIVWHKFVDAGLMSAREKTSFLIRY